MKIIICIVAGYLVFMVHQIQAQDKFVLEGTLTGYEEGIKFLIIPTLPNMSPDRDHETAVYLVDNKFTFTAVLKEPSEFTLLALPKIPPDNPVDFEAVSFWAENKPMTLSGKKGNLHWSEIHGSEIQDQFVEYTTIAKTQQEENKRIKDSVLTYKLSEQARTPLRKIREVNDAVIDKGQTEFMLAHPDYLSCLAQMVMIIYHMPEKFTKDHVAAFYEDLSDDFKSNVYGMQIKKFLGKTGKPTRNLTVGDRPHPFVLSDSARHKLKLSSLTGNFILLDFWAAGCGPCRSEHRNYANVYKKYQSKGFEVLSVSMDESYRQWTKAMVEDNMVWKSVIDNNRSVSTIYKVSYIPKNYLISREGIIIGEDLRGEALVKKLEQLLGSK